MLENKIILSELFNSSLVYCKPQKSNSKQLVNARNKDKGSWAFRQAEDKHTILFNKSRSKYDNKTRILH